MPVLLQSLITRRLTSASIAFLRLRKLPQDKIENSSAIIRSNLLRTINRAQTPLLAIHIRPDGDALGAVIALALYQKARGQEPKIFLPEKEMAFIPNIFKKIIEKKGLEVVHEIAGQSYQDVILLDTPGSHRLEEPVRKMLEEASGTVNIVDIDHHLGEKLMAPAEKSLVSAKVSSASELLFSILPQDQVSQSMARCLLAGIIDDTANLNFMVKTETRTRVKQLERLAGISKEETYVSLRALTAADQDLSAQAIKRAVTTSINGYKMTWVAVSQEELTDHHANWRRAVEEQIGFSTQKPDIVLVMYYDTKKNVYRGGLKAYNNGEGLDFRPVAKAISDGGGHPGAVGFNLPNHDPKNPAATVDMVAKALRKESI